MITATFNVSTAEVLINAETDVSSQDEAFGVEIGFTSNKEVTEFTELTFGFTLRADGEVVVSKDYPESDTVYESTDQDVMTVDQLPVLSGKQCSLEVWASNDGVLIEDTYSWTVPTFSEPNTSDTSNDSAS